MAVLDIKRYPEHVLTKKASPVNGIDGNIQRLIDDMIETMYAAPGVGLAAPQVGISKQLMVIDVRPKEEHPLIVLINPEIVYADGTVESEEGCLSVPKYVVRINRAERVVARGLDREGNKAEIDATGFLSTAIQHEIDHLNGILIIDRLGPLRKELFRKRYQKILKGE